MNVESNIEFKLQTGRKGTKLKVLFVRKKGIKPIFRSPTISASGT